MSDDPLPKFPKPSIYLRGFGRNKKRNSLILIILVVAASLFFSIFFKKGALAEKSELPVLTPDFDVIDPLERIGQGFQEKLARQNENQALCKIISKEDEVDVEQNPLQAEYLKTVSGHPMEAMIPFIVKEDKVVAAFLIGIAKKESDWGTHSPKKKGKECYNYWGYKGGYNVTEGGYSCFDSPEQAVAVVGTRIHDLVAKKIDTPARMVVWKCGSTCAGHDPVAVKKWIADVSQYYYRLET